MTYAMEAWTIPVDDGAEEPCETAMVDSAEFHGVAEKLDAMIWAFARAEEGFWVRMWVR